MNITAVTKAVAATIFLSSAAAHAAVIDFSAANVRSELVGSSLTGYVGTTYVEDGFRLQSSYGVLGVPATSYSKGSYAMAGSVGSTTTLTSLDSLTFSATSIDLKRLSSILSRDWSVTFVGTKADSTTVSQTFSFDNRWATYDFTSAFTNLSSLSWTESLLVTRDFMFDKLCTYMEPNYHQYEFDLRLYLTELDAGGSKLYT